MVAAVYDCPNFASGDTCPPTSGSDYLWTSYELGVGSEEENYTGYPYFSPYEVTPSWADALMASNDATYQYVTTYSHHRTDGSVAYQTTNTYNFLHLQIESAISVAVPQENGSAVLTLSKEVSNCYALPGNEGDCPMDQASYNSLPANYQTPVTVGTCVYNTSSGTARLSVVTRQYDDFGKLLVSKQYHGTGSTGMVSDCSRATRLDPSGLQLVHAEHQAYDTPTVSGDGVYLTLGPDARHYGNLTATESFVYLDDDQSSTTPAHVTLTCRTMAGDSANVPPGSAVAESIEGDLPTSASMPGHARRRRGLREPELRRGGRATQDQPLHLLLRGAAAAAHDDLGRNLSDSMYDRHHRQIVHVLHHRHQGRRGIVPGDTSVFEQIRTDAQGHQNTSRSCTLNGFPLSTTGANDQTVTFAHDALGLTTRINYPNDTYTTFDYHYACPTAPGEVATCPSSITACPYDTQSPARSCTATTLHAGTDTSYVDGVTHARIKDGLGREVKAVDNLGGVAGSGYTAQQTRAQQVFDDLSRLTQRTVQIGVTNYLAYTFNITFDPKFRPAIICDGRGTAQQFVHDDVMQHVKLAFNGQQHQQQSRNDSGKLIGLIDCPAVDESTKAGSHCPTTAADTGSATCSGNGYQTAIQRDGAGTQRGITASDPNAAATGASIESISGVPTYSAKRFKYGYSIAATAPGGSGAGALTAEASWKRDLLGRSLQHSMTVTPDGRPSGEFTSDSWVYNDVALLTKETNKLVDSASGDPLTETYEYTQTDKLSQHTSYAGVTFNNYYDSMDRMVRFCYASGTRSEGKTVVRDPISGKVTSVTHFTNPTPCSACTDGDCGDTAVSTISYVFTPFDTITSKTYTDSRGTTILQWGYDAYHRVVCFADAAATAIDSRCPESPVPSSFAPSTDQELVTVSYYPQSNTHLRGLQQSTCRGIPEVVDGTLSYVTQCIDTDYYTSVETGGSC